MGLNDEQEKLRQAEEWLRTAQLGSPHATAAWEHVKYVLSSTSDPALRAKAQEIADMVLGKGAFN